MFGDSSDTILQVHFGQSIPRDLKPDICTCDIYTDETNRYDPNKSEHEAQGSCFTCLDWAVRANLRVYVHKRTSAAVENYQEENTFCYDVKWQSYDTLLTPLVDCFILNDEQWFGLGDIQSPIWPLDKLQFEWTSLATNLSSEFAHSSNLFEAATNQLAFGSYANFSLFLTQGIYISNLIGLSLKISQDSKTGARKLCISVSYTDKCSQTWSRGDHLERRSSLLTTEADGIQIGGSHPNSFNWNDHYRNGVSELTSNLFYKEKIYTLPQWTGDFGYIELAPRHCDWNSLRSVVGSVLNLGMIGFSLIRLGSVWKRLSMVSWKRKKRKPFKT